MELELAYQSDGQAAGVSREHGGRGALWRGGGRRKSYAICWDALMRCLKYPQTHAYLFRRTYPELEMTLVRTMHAHCAEGAGANTSPARMSCG